MISTRFSCAVITGASSGLGAEFARQLAARCSSMVIVARREDRLKVLAVELIESAPGLSVFIVQTDLGTESGRESLVSYLKQENLSPDLLINNAGLGDYGSLESAEWAKVNAMLSVNIEALVYFTKVWLPDLKKNKGALINVSSLAAQLSMPDFAVYAATKAFVTSFTEAIHSEMRDFGVRVVNVCPGPVATEFGDVARRHDFKGDLVPGRNFFYTTQEQVVSEAIHAMDAGTCTHFPNWKVRFVARMLKFIPRTWVNAFMYRVGRRASVKR